MQYIKKIHINRALIVILLFIIILTAFKFVTENDNIQFFPENPDENISGEPDGNENLNNIIDYYFISTDKVTGRWDIVGYVNSIDDFDAKHPNKTGLSFYFYSGEFFEDGTVNLRFKNGEKLCEWTKRYINTGDHFTGFSNLISVYMIKNISGVDYMFAEFKNFSSELLHALEVLELSEISGANETDASLPGYYALKKTRMRELVSRADASNKDLRNYDLSNLNAAMYTLTFNEKTKFPTNNKKLPPFYEYQPSYIMEHGKNPGLGVKVLHAQGITGKGVNVAVIDEALDLNHPEYRGKIIEYKNFDGKSKSSMQGPAVASLLAGENIGTAPGVNIYYAAVPGWQAFDAKYYADALDWVVERNKTLPDGEKIKVVCISPNPKDMLPWINVIDYLESFKRAEDAGILVLDCTNEHGVILGACYYDFDDPENVKLCKPIRPYRIMIAPYHYDTIQDIYIDEEDDSIMLRVPVNYRTMAETYGEGDFSYQYEGSGDLSWAIPYATGVLAMGWQVKPELKPNEIVKILFDTAYVDKDGKQYINPTAFIDYLRNH